MFRLKPILIFCIAFSLGSTLAFFLSVYSDLDFLWIPVVGFAFGAAVLIIRKMTPLCHGIIFVLFVIASFIFYTSHRDFKISNDPLSSTIDLERVLQSKHLYLNHKILLNLIENPNTSCEMLKKLSNHKRLDLQEAALRKQQERNCNPINPGVNSLQEQNTKDL